MAVKLTGTRGRSIVRRDRLKAGYPLKDAQGERLTKNAPATHGGFKLSSKSDDVLGERVQAVRERRRVLDAVGEEVGYEKTRNPKEKLRAIEELGEEIGYSRGKRKK